MADERIRIDPQERDSRSTDDEREHEHRPPPLSAISGYLNDDTGSAALTKTEDWVRTHSSPESNDGRSPTRTYFDARDAPGHYPSWQQGRDPQDKRSWQTLANWQDGCQSDISRGGQNWAADKTRWIDTFSDQLGATEYHVQRTKHILGEIDMAPYQSRSIPVELVIVGILSIQIDKDITDFENRTLARPGVTDLLDDLEHSINEFETIRSLLKQNDRELLFPNTENTPVQR